jgi:hypothetical protein
MAHWSVTLGVTYEIETEDEADAIELGREWAVDDFGPAANEMWISAEREDEDDE